MYPLSLIRSRKGNWLHIGSIPIIPTIIYGQVAPMVERGPEEPSVGGSSPPLSAILRSSSVVF